METRAVNGTAGKFYSKELTVLKKKSGLCPRLLRADLKALGMFCLVKACVYLEGLVSH